MKKSTCFVLGLLAMGIAVAEAGETEAILKFGTMIGNRGPFVGMSGSIRGVPAGGAPWIVQGGAQGALEQNGKLTIVVRGLVLTSTRMNPSPFFRGLVSCLSIDENGEANTVNVSTENFPASVPDGDSKIEATVELPIPCFAPIIFVTSMTGAWFATTGLDAPE